MFFISFSRILPLDEFFYVAKSFQILQNQYKFSIILFRIMENWRFDIILLCLKWFCYIEKLIEWQNWRKAYKNMHKSWFFYKIGNSQPKLILPPWNCLNCCIFVQREFSWIQIELTSTKCNWKLCLFFTLSYTTIFFLKFDSFDFKNSFKVDK